MAVKTAFVLVPGLFTGGWIWRDLAGRLRAAGAGAHPVTLPGGDADLEAHIGEILRVVDGIDADTDTVLVGHGYGIAPVLGAADRRANDRPRLRVVHLDAGLPQDGDPALALLADQALRGRLTAEPTDDAHPPPPGADGAADGGWARHGSTDGLTPQDLDRLSRLAAPQPVRTLTQPLRLTGAVHLLPSTGVLCTANGNGIALLEHLVELGDPRLRPLTEPRFTFFELDTGHWPMLSTPAELTEVLLKAAAGEGHRLRGGSSTDGPPPQEPPAHLRPFLLDAPEPPRPRERTYRLELHLPDGGDPAPAILFVHGGPLPPDVRPSPLDWPTFLGYGQYVADLGVIGATVHHRLHDLGAYGTAADDVAEAVDRLRADPRVAADRVALWFFSGGGLLAADWLAAPPPWLRCVALTYPILAPLPNWGLSDSRFHPAAAVRAARGAIPPVVLTRVGREMPQIAATVAEFLAAAEPSGATVDLIDLPNAPHGFETVDHTAPAREAVQRATHTVLHHLAAP
ncbi:alpha/beta hydrolase [Streptomyces durbertensis]|uniref:Alpha/beta hydrolase n=1 Tax=Streptomyces durbertensis TaxID=2448886 RepID=A0ABR6EJT7_9ACTN|nr:alpha/beta hydrolase [Streptomyces durbertensis]MBB1245598.1 alpha/beta hydrolase [Streptomyces durbertensis]